jgi:hypothetical protein
MTARVAFGPATELNVRREPVHGFGDLAEHLGGMRRRREEEEAGEDAAMHGATDALGEHRRGRGDAAIFPALEIFAMRARSSPVMRASLGKMMTSSTVLPGFIRCHRVFMISRRSMSGKRQLALE